jgi:L-ascorbate metabolism protein UlaG (beta-lactamase superfamily)
MIHFIEKHLTPKVLWPTLSYYRQGLFHNTSPMQHKNWRSILKLLKAPKAPWPSHVAQNTHATPKRQSPSPFITSYLIGHSSILIQLPQMNILTDPVWAQRAGPLTLIGPKRVRPPAIQLKNLPPIDCVLVSHNHYDHMDIQTLKKLQEAFDPLFLVPLGDKALLNQQGILQVEEMALWDHITIKNSKESNAEGTTIHFVPSQHWSARSINDQNHSLWGGYIIEQVIEQKKVRLYFAGDTGLGPFVEEIHTRFPSIDLGFLPIGAYEPRWFMSEAHVNPEESVTIHQKLQIRQSLAIHHSTFQLTSEAIDAPFKDLTAALQKAQLPLDVFAVPAFGRPITFNATTQETCIAEKLYLK